MLNFLEEELRIRSTTSVIPTGVAFGKWRGLIENVVKDKKIVWPPTVIIKNTLLEQDDKGNVIFMHMLSYIILMIMMIKSFFDSSLFFNFFCHYCIFSGMENAELTLVLLKLQAQSIPRPARAPRDEPFDF